MPKIADSIKAQLKKFKSQKVVDFQGLKEAKEFAEQVEFPTPEETAGLDPAHGLYIHVFNTIMAMFEQFAPLPEIGPFYDVIEKADDVYMPKGPPWSPLTGSFFNSWSILDLRVGKDKETFASVVLNLAAELKLDSDMKRVLQLLADSRMGLYKYLGTQGEYLRFKELLTNKEVIAFTPLTFRGKVGDLWYMRILPPLVDGSYGVIFTTPYIISANEEAGWYECFKRNLTGLDSDTDKAIHAYFKFGRSLHYWNEYVFESYYGDEPEAIYLTGFPDVPLSRPHSKETERASKLATRPKGKAASVQDSRLEFT